MRRMVLALATAFLAVVASGLMACTTLGGASAGAAEHASKAVFCGANDSIDRASANVTTNAGFLAVLKSHAHDLAVMKKDAPGGSLGQTVQQVVSTAEAALASDNANELNNLPSGGSVDTYCGVDGMGNPLPSYFGTGKTTTFCSTFLPIFAAVGNAPDAAGRLAALSAHKSQITQLSSELSTLPKSIKAKATTTVDQAQTAVSTNSAAALNASGGSASYVALYCGQNQ
jgi:hypothetical protein